jgi:hypothetical protein
MLLFSFAPASALETAFALSAEQVTSEFVRSGFVVDAPIFWESSELTTFFVRDADDDARILLVLVYPDASRATAQRQLAEAQEAAELGEPGLFTDELGPELVPGYGRSFWLANVALVQASRPSHALDADNEQSPRIRTVLTRRAELAALTAVEPDFISVVRAVAA